MNRDDLRYKIPKPWLIITFLSIIILSLPFFFARGVGIVDDTNFLIIAKWMKYGFKPYNDLAELKPPGIYYVLYLINIFFGEAWWVSRVFIFLIDILFAVLIIFFLKRIYNSTFAWLGGINLYTSLILFGGYRIHTEILCALLGMLGLFLISNKKDLHFKDSLLFGIIIGISSIFKQPGIFYLIAYILFLIFKKIPKKEKLLNGSFIILGFSIIWIIIIFLLYKYSLLKNFIRYVIVMPFIFPGDPKYLHGLKLLLRTPVILILITLIPLMIKREKINYNFLGFEFLLFLVIIFFYIPILKRPTPHYYICLLFALVILSVKVWLKLLDYYISRINLKPFFIYLLLILPSLHLIAGIVYGSIFFIKEKRLQYDCLIAHRLGEIINTYTSEKDPILCFSPSYVSSRLYYLIERRPLLPYFSITPMERESKYKFEELLNIIKEASVPVVIIEDEIDKDDFTVVPKIKFLQALSDKYRKINFCFDKDYSRKKKIEIYILKTLNPKINTPFKSNIFPDPCLNRIYYKCNN
ncbi:MAG: glycosyltransferase family 39 protein [Candidatus Omnitrophica bacterium]|nr:glycosyltransferase family 39 protein [Candidatus Omnitrophota bacterium]